MHQLIHINERRGRCARLLLITVLPKFGLYQIDILPRVLKIMEVPDHPQPSKRIVFKNNLRLFHNLVQI